MVLARGEVGATRVIHQATRVSKADEGTYSCSAKNEAGEIEEVVQVLVYDQDGAYRQPNYNPQGPPYNRPDYQPPSPTPRPIYDPLPGPPNPGPNYDPIHGSDYNPNPLTGPDPQPGLIPTPIYNPTSTTEGVGNRGNTDSNDEGNKDGKCL